MAVSGVIQRNAWSILLLFALVIGIGVFFLFIYFNSLSQKAVEELAVKQAESTVENFKKVRTYYSEEIVKKIKAANGDIKVAAVHSDAMTVPVPATFLLDMSDILQKAAKEQMKPGEDRPGGLIMKMYSLYPFANRTHTYDDFGKEALSKCSVDPTKPYVNVDWTPGKELVRVAVADLMKESCVTCHNSHKDSPKKDWKVGDVRGVIEVDFSIADHIKEVAKMREYAVYLGVVAIGLVGVLSLTLFMGVRAQQSRAGQILQSVSAAAQGDLTKESGIRGSDEIGRIGEGLTQLFAMQRGSVGALWQNAQTLYAAAEGLAGVSRGMSENAQSTYAQASTLSAATEQLLRQVQAAALAAEKLAAGLKDGSRHSQETAHWLSEAVNAAQSAKQAVARLDQNSASVSTLLRNITNNMLALNSTTDPEKIKAMARTSATDAMEVTQKIGAVQSDVRGVLDALQQFSTLTAKLNAAQAAVGKTLDEQVVQAGEIGKHASDAIKGRDAINQNIHGLAQSAQTTNNSAGASYKTAQELANMAAEMQRLVSRFKC